MSATRVYRLDVTYPPGSLVPGWEPAGWDPEPAPYDEDRERFRWPVNRLCLTPTTAKRRAALFRSYGAQVEIVPSKPIEWPAECICVTEQYDGWPELPPNRAACPVHGASS